MIQNHLLRMGGHLSHSFLEEDAKHPLILPADYYLKTLLIRDAHHRTLHGGTPLTLAILRRQYWIVKGRSAVKKVIRVCLTCSRHAARAPTQLIGELSQVRVRPLSPFELSGVDNAGPINVRLTKTEPVREHSSTEITETYARAHLQGESIPSGKRIFADIGESISGT